MVNVTMTTNGAGWDIGDKGFICGWVMNSLDVPFACVILSNKTAICAECSDFVAD